MSSWHPTIDNEKCNNCGWCVEFCSLGVYSNVNGSVKVVNPDNCVDGCSGCEEAKKCPADAISFPPNS